MMSPATFARLERLVALRRQREALALARIHAKLVDIAARREAAHARAAASITGPGGPGDFIALAALQRWEGAQLHHLEQEEAAVRTVLTAAEAGLRTARATEHAMELLGRKVAKAAKIKATRRQELADATRAANRVTDPKMR